MEWGVLPSSAAGATWARLPALPAVAVYALLFHGGSSTLTAGTYGRGAFTLKLAPSIVAQPAMLAISKPKGGAADPVMLAVSDGETGGSVVYFTATPADPWLAVSPSSG